MPVKESSDELNPAVIMPDSNVAQTKTARTASDYLALAIATCGVGYLPLVPGTWGSMVGVAIFLVLRWIAVEDSPRLHFWSPQHGLLALTLLGILIVTLLGIWAASRTEKLAGRKDPGKVVVDEVAGQLIALLPLTLFAAWPLKVGVIVSFVLFRLFDIVKPYPARRLEGLHGGLGIMCDDLVAGVYAAVVTVVFMTFVV